MLPERHSAVPIRENQWLLPVPTMHIQHSQNEHSLQSISPGGFNAAGPYEASMAQSQGFTGGGASRMGQSVPQVPTVAHEGANGISQSATSISPGGFNAVERSEACVVRSQGIQDISSWKIGISDVEAGGEREPCSFHVERQIGQSGQPVNYEELNGPGKQVILAPGTSGSQFIPLENEVAQTSFYTMDPSPLRGKLLLNPVFPLQPIAERDSGQSGGSDHSNSSVVFRINTQAGTSRAENSSAGNSTSATLDCARNDGVGSPSQVPLSAIPNSNAVRTVQMPAGRYFCMEFSGPRWHWIRENHGIEFEKRFSDDVLETLRHYYPSYLYDVKVLCVTPTAEAIIVYYTIWGCGRSEDLNHNAVDELLTESPFIRCFEMYDYFAEDDASTTSSPCRRRSSRSSSSGRRSDSRFSRRKKKSHHRHRPPQYNYHYIPTPPQLQNTRSCNRPRARRPEYSFRSMPRSILRKNTRPGHQHQPINHVAVNYPSYAMSSKLNLPPLRSPGVYTNLYQYNTHRDGWQQATYCIKDLGVAVQLSP